MRPITQQIQAIQTLESAGASRQLAEAIAATVEASALAARDAAWERVEAKIDALRTEVNGRFDALRAEMDRRDDALRAEMNSRFDKVDVRIATVEANLERSLRVTTVSLMVFVIALAGLILAILRFFPALR